MTTTTTTSSSSPGGASTQLVQPHYPLLRALKFGAITWTGRTFWILLMLLRRFGDWRKPPAHKPDLVKTYKCRPALPVRIFFPRGYQRSSANSAPLPTLFAIHGGGFVIGDAMDDDACNRRFADMHGVLVVELNYRKAPGHPFPTAIHDVEALMLAAHADTETLPMIDKSRVAVTGYSAGGNLCLSVCQLPSIRTTIRPQAAVPVYPVTDMTVSPGERAKRRYYKTTLSGMRGKDTDFLAASSPYFNWSYIPYGQDLRDPLLSPIFAPREHLPTNIFIVAAELDQLTHETWRMACQLSGRPVPTADQKPGQELPASTAEAGKLITQGDERFYFEHEGDGTETEGGSLRWLLVPDVTHGFDHMPPSSFGDEGAIRDAADKTVAYQKLVGEWLHGVVWRK